MTSAFLQSELASLIQDSKRKYVDVRGAAEKSLGDIKAISVTSEAQLAADLQRKSQFIDPFILACNSKQAKLAITGAVCLQRLVASRAIPRGRLSEVLDAFQEASQQGYDVQLKILQALPSLLQLYTNELQGDPLAKVLSLCGGLASSKTGLVSSTAGATFQQLITSVFERVASQKQQNDTEEASQSIAVSDASKVFGDMCMVVKSEKPRFLRTQDISLHLALEVIENCLSNDDLDILNLPDCISVCETHLIPGITASLQTTNSYAIFSQFLRITYLLTTTHLVQLSSVLPDVFVNILDWLDRGVSGGWKRVLCLELMRDICSDFDTLRLLYSHFDQLDSQKNIVQDLMGTLVRIASEDPTLIGLGRQSTVPTNTTDSSSNMPTSMEVSDFDAVGSVMQANSNVTGISTKWSTISSPLLEEMDRKQAPDIPETYVYTLVLACAAAFSEGLSKYIMPLTVPARANTKIQSGDDGDVDTEPPGRRNSQRAQKYQRLQNPLKRDDINELDDVRVCAAMVENCWPAVLATCSTFLNSALDSYFYHILVRTVQKLAQVSGVMELLTPRDALLTTLAKVSVPINASSLVALLYGSKLAKRTVHDIDLPSDDESIKSPLQSTPKPSMDSSRQTLNIRNLLCVRALLNLGIALGPTLSGTSWFIIIQTLQQVEALMSVSPTAKSAQGPLNSHPVQVDNEGHSTLSTEIAAVGTASKRMIESTRTYTDTSLDTFVQSVFKLIDSLAPSVTNGSNESSDESTKRPALTPRTIATHKASRSISGINVQTGVLAVEVEFVLKTISDLARVNLYRFASRRSKAVSWDLIASRLLGLIAVRDVEPTLRLQAASIVDLVSIESARLLEKQNLDPEGLNFLQQACLVALSMQLDCLYHGHTTHQDVITTEVEIHRRLLDALEDIVSHSGESLKQGWRVVFKILQLTVKRDLVAANVQEKSNLQYLDRQMMARTLPVAFRTVQLIVADFLRSIDSESLWVLVQLLPLFGMQQHDLNISLTTATLFWNINSLVLEREQSIDQPNSVLSGNKDLHNSGDDISFESSTLWYATMIHLAELAEDTRSDVRNGAIRVLLKIFDASGDHLTPEMWNLSVQKILLSPLKQYATTESDPREYLSSFSQLLSGTTELITQHLPTITKAVTFSDTWTEIVFIYDRMLDRRSIAGHISVFESANTLVRSLPSANITNKELLHQLLHLWLQHHPADLVHTEASGSSEFAKHAQLLQEIDRCNSDSIASFMVESTSIDVLIAQSSKKSILSVGQDKYSSDIKKLSAEQAAVLENLHILSRLMSTSQHMFSTFLQDLIKDILLSHPRDTKVGDVSHRNSKPTFVAFMSACIELLRTKIPGATTNEEWLNDIAANTSLDVLARVIKTKYSDFPINEAAPAWQKATMVATELLQAASLYTTPLTESALKSLAPAIPYLAEAILNATGLEQAASLIATTAGANVISDEEFDIKWFSQFHAAATPLLARSDYPELERKKYVLVLFHASLISKPWFGDLPLDLTNDPLQGLDTIRAGSIRVPEFFVRNIIPFESNKALFGLVACRPNVSEGSGSTDELALARTAAPYVLVRLAHSLKCFLADQRLRYLNPPPRLIQKELSSLLNSALKLSSLGEAFSHISSKAASNKDGKTHLRILYPLILRMKEFWVTLPRVEFAAWQDDDDGRAINAALQTWSEAICQTWPLQA